MRVVIQRATSAEVVVEGRTVGSLTTPGLVVLVGVTGTDTATTAEKLAEKVWGLRILAEEKSASDLNAPLLVVSQFTLYASTRKGRRRWGVAGPPGTGSGRVVDIFVTTRGGWGAKGGTGGWGGEWGL